MKYSKLENKAIKSFENNKEKYYKYVLTICENDLDNIDECCSPNNSLGEFFNVELNKSKQKRLLDKIQNIFKREHAQINGTSNDLISWLDFLELEYDQRARYLRINREVI